MIPINLFTVDEDSNADLEDIEVETDATNDGSYTLYLLRTLYDHSETSAPDSLGVPESVTVTDCISGAFAVNATSPQPIDGENHWINVTIRAVKQGVPPVR